MEDILFQRAVEIVEDRFARLSPCELMAMKCHEVIECIDGKEITVNILVSDFNDIRNIGIVAVKNLIVGHRKFIKGISVELTMRRMENNEAIGLYD